MSSAEQQAGPKVSSKQRSEGLSPTELSLRELFDRYYASTWRLLRRLGVHSASLDDAAQEVFWVTSRKLSMVRGGSEQAFLYGVAKRVAADFRRKEGALHLVEDIEDLRTSFPSPEDLNEERQARRLLDEVLERMSSNLRSVFVFAVIEELPLAEVAQIEQVPLGTVNSRLRRAKAEFKLIAARLRAALCVRKVVS
jgi:RNA polymerase sigma-70 factor (ECF subfamily)